MPRASRRPRTDATDARRRESSGASGKTPILERRDHVRIATFSASQRRLHFCVGSVIVPASGPLHATGPSTTPSDRFHDRGCRDSTPCSNPSATIIRGKNEDLRTARHCSCDCPFIRVRLVAAGSLPCGNKWRVGVGASRRHRCPVGTIRRNHATPRHPRRPADPFP